MIKKFTDFKSDSSVPTDAAGIAVVLKNSESTKILLVHPTNSSWASPRMGIPKGRIELGESIQEAAVRETYEETGILIKVDQLEPGIETAEVWKGTKFMYNIHYLVCKIKSPEEIGLTGLRVPKQQLQTEEIDWAGFVEINDAYEKVVSSQRIILDRVR